MAFFLGLDIGGTKIAGAAYDNARKEIARQVVATPEDYASICATCVKMVETLAQSCAQLPSLGIGVPCAVDPQSERLGVVTNLPCLSHRPFRPDLEKTLMRPVRMANDASCAALSEAIDGAGQGCQAVFGLVIGTGVGGGLVLDGKLMEGAHGIAGEIGHTPLPFRETLDGPSVPCACGLSGCIDKSISGGALSRLYAVMIGREAQAHDIAAMAEQGDADALKVLERFYVTIAKAMAMIINIYDPDIIAVTGGLSQLRGLYDHVPRRWGNYAMRKENLRTRLLPARHGAMTGLRGAAWIGAM
ncbi:MAG: ROK family protein [Bdellovibrionales bacterium]